MMASGCYGLTPTITLQTVAHVYKALWTVEDIIRTTKSILETRAIYHKRDETIRGNVFCSFLALLLKVELEQRMQFADLECEWAQVLRGLEAFQQVEATFQDKRFLLRSQLNAEASATLRAAGVAAPPAVRELPQSGRSGENVVPKRFGAFISIDLRETYIFEVSKIGLTV